MPPFRHGSSLQFLWSWYFYPCNPNSGDIIGKLYVEDTSVAITIYQPWHLRMIPHLENGWCRIWRTDHRSIHLPFHIFAVSPPWSLSLSTRIYIYIHVYIYISNYTQIHEAPKMAQLVYKSNDYASWLMTIVIGVYKL